MFAKEFSSLQSYVNDTIYSAFTFYIYGLMPQDINASIFLFNES